MSKLRTHFYFFTKRRSLMRRLQRKIRQDERAAALHGDSSKSIYDEYGQRELKQYDHGVCRALVHGVLKRLTHKEVRDAYVAPVIAQIQSILESGSGPVRVLEVGCGNGTNLMLLRQYFGDSVSLAGIDISGKRIEVGQGYWSDRLSGVQMHQASAMDLSLFPAGSFDLVYSICALEQMTFRIHEAISEMKRVSKGSIVCVEPVYEYGNAVQRLYNIVNDQCRTLLQDMRSCDLELQEQGLLSILHNPLNPVGVVVARKAA